MIHQDHVDVFFYIMERVYDAYTSTGVASPIVTVTRSAICAAMGRQASGRDYKMIDEAIDALSGTSPSGLACSGSTHGRS